MGPGQDKWAPGQMGPGQMGIRTNGSRTNASGLGLGHGNNSPGPICPRILSGTDSSSYRQLCRVIDRWQATPKRARYIRLLTLSELVSNFFDL